jgi:hypothetical protein
LEEPQVAATPAPQKKSRKRLIVAIVLLIIVVIIVIAAAASFSPLGPPPDYAVRVTMPAGQCWSGSIGVDVNQASHEGCGTRTIDVRDDCDIAVVAVIQKGFDDITLEPFPGTLTVDILRSGEVVETSSTSADFGVVSVSFSC